MRPEIFRHRQIKEEAMRPQVILDGDVIIEDRRIVEGKMVVPRVER